MQLNRKQVKALLDVISKDETRPVLCHAKIDTYEGRPVLVATDSYQLAAITLTDDVLPIMGYVIHRDQLTKWYKLASNKDYLTELDLAPMAEEDQLAFDGGAGYPQWQKIVTYDKCEPVAHVAINANYMLTMQILADCNGYSAGLTWEFFGNLAPVIAERNQNIYVVMPLKK